MMFFLVRVSWMNGWATQLPSMGFHVGILARARNIIVKVWSLKNTECKSHGKDLSRVVKLFSHRAMPFSSLPFSCLSAREGFCVTAENQE